MIRILGSLYYYLLKIYRISISYKKYEEIVWNDLKKHHKESEWQYGVYESDKHIETVFEISNKTGATFYYMVYEGSFHCRVKILESFNPEITTDLFVLATHFNNLLNNGVVVVNVQNSFVEYHTKSDYIVNIIYPGELNAQIVRHFKTSKDIFWAFNKLVNENEEPTIIIADLMNIYKNNDNKNNNNAAN